MRTGWVPGPSVNGDAKFEINPEYGIPLPSVEEDDDVDSTVETVHDRLGDRTLKEFPLGQHSGMGFS